MLQKTNLLIVIFLFLKLSTILSQGTILPFGNPSYDALERLEIKSGQELPYHSSIKPFLRGDAVRMGLQFLENDTLNLKNEQTDVQYLFDENNEWLGIENISTTSIAERGNGETLIESSETSPYLRKTKKPLLKTLYKTPANFFEVNDPDYHLRINPILNLSYSNAQNDALPLFLNQRGIELRGGVDDRIFFYSNILETQARFPNYVVNRIRKNNAIPGAGLYKGYEGDIIGFSDGYDFLNAQGILGFNITKHVGFQLGHGKHFIGNGYRSLLLSDFSNNQFFLKFNWKIWRFQLQNIFSELTAGSKTGPDALLPKKYMAAHYLDYNISKNVSIGFFETVIFHRRDHFEFQYLNPVIFYRTVEQMIGSPDNVLLGLNGKWNFLQRFQLYGQVILDEFKINEVFVEKNGWWANKYGMQAGLKYVDALGVENLDLQFETNFVRPYTYTHFDSVSVYSHFNQELAHPLGANFQEYIGILRYKPFKKLQIELKTIYFEQGEDEKGSNWGSNILISSATREMEYGNELLQGINSNTTILKGTISYNLFHNGFIDLNFFKRSKTSFSTQLDLETLFIGIGFRMNSGRWDLEF